MLKLLTFFDRSVKNVWILLSFLIVRPESSGTPCVFDRTVKSGGKHPTILVVRSKSTIFLSRFWSFEANRQYFFRRFWSFEANRQYFFDVSGRSKQIVNISSTFLVVRSKTSIFLRRFWSFEANRQSFFVVSGRSKQIVNISSSFLTVRSKTSDVFPSFLTVRSESSGVVRPVFNIQTSFLGPLGNLFPNKISGPG